jgi:hypothetical protein
MLKNVALALRLLAGLSACAAPYGYPGYGYSPGMDTLEPRPITPRPSTTDPTTRTSACNLEPQAWFGVRRAALRSLRLPGRCRPLHRRPELSSALSRSTLVIKRFIRTNNLHKGKHAVGKVRSDVANH